MRPLGVVFVGGVGLNFFGLLFVLCGIVFGHGETPVLVKGMCRRGMGMSSVGDPTAFRR
jgi:hypothetical protein